MKQVDIFDSGLLPLHITLHSQGYGQGARLHDTRSAGNLLQSGRLDESFRMAMNDSGAGYTLQEELVINYRGEYHDERD